MIHMISSLAPQSPNSYDPWVVPHTSTIDSLGDSKPLSLVEVTYDAIQYASYNFTLDEQQLVALIP